MKIYCFEICLYPFDESIVIAQNEQQARNLILEYWENIDNKKVTFQWVKDFD